MWLFKLFLTSGLLAMGAWWVEAADLEVQLVDKNCWVEVFDDTKYDASDPHAKLQGPKEYAALKDVNGKNWSNDIESIIVGAGTTVRAYKERDFEGPEIVLKSGQRVPYLSDLDMANDIESMKIVCETSGPQNPVSGGTKSSPTTDRTGIQPGDRPSAPPSSTSTTTTTTTTTPR
ncbi:MAG: hypothetical protein ABI980_13600 [Nitrospirota bacterium]